jgi:hypothetical protein
MKRTKRLAGSIVVSSLIVTLFVVAAATWYLYFVASRNVLAPMAPGDEMLPVSVTVYGRGTDTISARLAFYSADWSILNTLERSWSGWEISLESCIVQTGTGWIVLPLVIRTDETREGQGVEITRYYDREGIPAIYESARITPRERSALRRLFSLARNRFPAGLAHGRLGYRTTTLREFESGVEYFLYVDAAGNVSCR